jgi:hypothetical protein
MADIPDESRVTACPSVYPECPPRDQRCVWTRHPVAGLHCNRAGFAWSDEEAAESAERLRHPVTVTEWGVKFTAPGKPPHVQQYYDETEARRARDEVMALSPPAVTVVVSRTITTSPWEEVRDDDGREH